MGIALDSSYAFYQDLIDQEELETILNGLIHCGLPIWCEEMCSKGSNGNLLLLEGLSQFQEHLGGILTITLPLGMGKKCDVHQMNPDFVAKAINDLKQRAKVGVG
jgi:3-dehydroquinate synthase